MTCPGLLPTNGAESYIESISTNYTVYIDPTATSGTTTIASVSTSRSHIVLCGIISEGGNADQCHARVELTNATTVTAYRNTLLNTRGVVVTFKVIQWKASAITSIQQNTITLTGVATNTRTITSVDLTRSAVFYLGQTTSNTTGSNSANQILTRVHLSSSTVVTATKGSATGTTTVGFVVVQWASALMNSSVQQKIITTTTTVPLDTSITSVGDEAVLVYGGVSSTTSTLYLAQSNARRTSTTNIRTNGYSTSMNSTIVVTVVDFVPGVMKSVLTDLGAASPYGVQTHASSNSLKSVTPLLGYDPASTSLINHFHLTSSIYPSSNTQTTIDVNTVNNPPGDYTVAYERWEFN